VSLKSGSVDCETVNPVAGIPWLVSRGWYPVAVHPVVGDPGTVDVSPLT
jgi:hypothetical protein